LVGTWTALLLGASLGQFEGLGGLEKKAPGPKQEVTASLEADRKQIQPGKPFTLVVKFKVPEGLWFYSPIKGSSPVGKPVKITMTPVPGFTFEKPKFPPHEIKQTPEGVTHVFKKDTVASIEATAPADLKEGTNVSFEASVVIQFCNEDQCFDVKSKQTLTLPVVAATAAVETDDAVRRMLVQSASATAEGASPEGVAYYLMLAFFGGIVLNVMPCVLPVITIKLLSFVQHSGDSRGKLLATNLVYTLGVLAVFAALATFAVGVREQSEFFAKWFGLKDFSWGQQFQSQGFNLFMACLVFAMSLSLLGVFEIPIPGFVGTAAGSAHDEGYLGAFLSGVVTTLLATPCTGPFMVVALAWSVQQPAWVAYAVWLTMGIGLAFPYLLIAVFPAAQKLLPRPGNWMVTFKQISGFILLATVLFILSSVKALMPAMVTLLGLGFAFWLLGTQINVLSSTAHKWRVRTLALASFVGIAWLGNWLQVPKLLKWQPFTEERMLQLVKEKKPILIDFTADWCLNCRTNERVAIETKAVEQLVKERGVVPLYADFTDGSEEIAKWIANFGSAGIPLTVVIPAGGDPSKTTVFKSLFSRQALVDAITKAAPNVIPPAERETKVASNAPGGPGG
jgi:thiol:disulfide interchange protein